MTNFPLFLALKYLRPKRSVASVITCVSVLGVMLGVAVVIIVRSVMTGFGDIWEEKILDFKPQHSNKQALIRNYDWYVEHLSEFQGKSGVSHRVPWKQGLLAVAKWFF